MLTVRERGNERRPVRYGLFASVYNEGVEDLGHSGKTVHEIVLSFERTETVRRLRFPIIEPDACVDADAC